MIERHNPLLIIRCFLFSCTWGAAANDASPSSRRKRERERETERKVCTYKVSLEDREFAFGGVLGR